MKFQLNLESDRTRVPTYEVSSSVMQTSHTAIYIRTQYIGVHYLLLLLTTAPHMTGVCTKHYYVVRRPMFSTYSSTSNSYIYMCPFLPCTPNIGGHTIDVHVH